MIVKMSKEVYCKICNMLCYVLFNLNGFIDEECVDEIVDMFELECWVFY